MKTNLSWKLWKFFKRKEHCLLARKFQTSLPVSLFPFSLPSGRYKTKKKVSSNFKCEFMGKTKSFTLSSFCRAHYYYYYYYYYLLFITYNTTVMLA